ncbi:MAG: CHAT domain-containing protein, partial [Bacteroidota bacterium]
EDHRLRAEELQHVPLKADLVVLSACETGVGAIAPGEGTLSLARSFLASGASTVVSTLWKVDDQSSAELMQTFYREIAAGTPTASALHQAKLEFLAKADSRTAHPFYWAGYVSSGVSRPIDLGPADDFPYSWAFAVLLALFGLAFLIWRSRNATPSRNRLRPFILTKKPFAGIF